MNNKNNNDNGKLFLPLGRSLEDLFDWSTVVLDKNLNLKNKRNEDYSMKILANEEEIAVFRFGNQAFAFESKCPHTGGPLHLGEIEELPDRSICIRCPWHGWKFDVKTGEIKYPTRSYSENCSASNLKLKTFPVKLKYETNNMFVGVDQLNPVYFKSTNF